MSAVDNFVAASKLVESVVKQVKAEDMDKPTPDSKWNVHDLINHLVSEISWVEPLVAGKTIAEVGSQFDGDLVGDDALGSWQKAAQSAAAAIKAPGTEARTVHLSWGDETGEEYCNEMFFDQLIHAWDLAVSIGASYEPPADLVSSAKAYFEPQAETWRKSGALGPAVAVASDVSEFDKLLALSGRNPEWPAN